MEGRINSKHSIHLLAFVEQGTFRETYAGNMIKKILHDVLCIYGDQTDMMNNDDLHSDRNRPYKDTTSD